MTVFVTLPEHAHGHVTRTRISHDILPIFFIRASPTGGDSRRRARKPLTSADRYPSQTDGRDSRQAVSRLSDRATEGARFRKDFVVARLFAASRSRLFRR